MVSQWRCACSQEKQRGDDPEDNRRQGGVLGLHRLETLGPRIGGGDCLQSLYRMTFWGVSPTFIYLFL
jgi:hypothetical protein